MARDLVTIAPANGEAPFSRSRAAPSLNPAAGSTLILRREALCDKRLGPRSILDARELGADRRAVQRAPRASARLPRAAANQDFAASGQPEMAQPRPPIPGEALQTD